MIPPTRSNTDGSSTQSRIESVHLITSIVRDIIKRFPALEMLDNERIVKVGFDAPTPHADSSHRVTPAPTTNSFARPMAPSFVTNVDGTLVSEFLTRCVQLGMRGSVVRVLTMRSIRLDSSPFLTQNDPNFWMCIILLRPSRFLPTPRFHRELEYRAFIAHFPIKRISNGMFGWVEGTGVRGI